MELVKKGKGAVGVLPSINVYGSKLWSDAYVIGRRDFAARLMEVKVENIDRPQPGFPKKPDCNFTTRFDYSNSPYFALSGSVTDAFKTKTIEFYDVKDIINSDTDYLDTT
jgi:hypothetical protein